MKLVYLTVAATFVLWGLDFLAFPIVLTVMWRETEAAVPARRTA